MIVDTTDGREDGVHGDDPDGQALLGVVRGEVARAPLDGEVHLDGGVRLQGQDVLLRVDDLDVRRLDDVRRGDRAGAALDELELRGMGHVALEAQPLEVEEDLDDILLDPRDGAELVRHVPDLHGRDGSALERREQHATQGVAQRHAVAGTQRAGLVLAVRLALRILDGRDLRVLQLDHVAAYLE